MVDVPEIQLQKVFYPGFSKPNITYVQAPILWKKILLADKADNHYCIVAIPTYVAAKDRGRWPQQTEELLLSCQSTHYG